MDWIFNFRDLEKSMGHVTELETDPKGQPLR